MSQYVDKAIAQTVKDHPELFDLSVDLFDGNYKVRERGPYIKAVVAAIHAQGVCAQEEFEEVAVKTSNSFNEQYNIWVLEREIHPQGTPGAYITTCFPRSVLRSGAALSLVAAAVSGQPLLPEP